MSLLLFETFLFHITREIQRALFTICLHMNRKAHVATLPLFGASVEGDPVGIAPRFLAYKI